MTEPSASAGSSRGSRGLVSIVLTTLNAAAYLSEAVESCLAQSYRQLELIVVDGGSSDGTLELLATCQDPRMRLVHQEGNAGRLPGAIDLGLAHSAGEFVTWMQADSYYSRDAIEKMVQVLETHPAVGQVYADFYEIDTSGQVVKVCELREPGDFLDAIGDPAGCCFLLRRGVWEEVGPHDVSTFPSHDFDYRMRIALRFLSFHLREPLYYWRYREDSLTGQYGWLALARNDAAIRVRLGLDRPRQARRRRAEVEMAYAFECYEQKRWSAVPRQVWEGVRRDWRFVRNPGVWSIVARSLAQKIGRASTGKADRGHG